jgi:hypothetical protein
LSNENANLSSRTLSDSTGTKMLRTISAALLNIVALRSGRTFLLL